MNGKYRNGRSRRLAFLDLGTNAARLAVYAIGPRRPPSLLAERRIVTRLGAGARGRRLAEAGMRRALVAARRLASDARRLRAPITAIATAAVRDAANRADFLERFRAAAGVPLQIIGGSREARLVYRALADSIPAKPPPTLMLDIGGGSAELIIGTSRRIYAAVSLPLGAVRLSELYPRAMGAGPVPGAVYRQMQRYVIRSAGARLRALRRYGAVSAVGVAGTAGAVAALLAARQPAPDNLEPVIAPRSVERLAERMRRLPLAQRRALPGMTAGRADIILAGLAVLSVILRDLRIQRLRLSRAGLRDGLLREALEPVSPGGVTASTGSGAQSAAARPEPSAARPGPPPG